MVRTPSKTNKSQAFWAARKAAEALSHTAWDLFQLAAMQGYAAQTGQKTKGAVYEDGVLPCGVLPADQLQRLRTAFEACPAEAVDVDNTDFLYSFDPYPDQSAMRNRSSIMRRVSDDLCDVVTDILTPHIPMLEAAMGHRFHVPQIWAHAYRNFGPEVNREELSAAVWHLDGCPLCMKKIFFYLDDVSEETGTTGFRTRGGREFKVTGPAGTWALFEPAVVYHQAVVPLRSPRPVVEVLITPAMATDPRPVNHGLNCGFPYFPLNETAAGLDEIYPPEFTENRIRHRTLARWHKLSLQLNQPPMEQEGYSPYQLS
ncbi:hypothetical protein [Magnetospira thiophila]